MFAGVQKPPPPETHSDPAFTRSPVEQRLVRALAWRKSASATRTSMLHIAAKALTTAGARDEASDAALERMALAAPLSVKERLLARLVRLALESTNENSRSQLRWLASPILLISRTV